MFNSLQEPTEAISARSASAAFVRGAFPSKVAAPMKTMTVHFAFVELPPVLGLSDMLASMSVADGISWNAATHTRKGGDRAPLRNRETGMGCGAGATESIATKCFEPSPHLLTSPSDVP